MKAFSKIDYPITPIAKPRMTRRDKWLDPPRENVRAYRNFCRRCNLIKLFFPHENSRVTFILPMPESWSNKKKSQMNGQAHQSKPDLDNLLKGLSDAIYADDSMIWDVHVTKLWGYEGAIIIEEFLKIK